VTAASAPEPDPDPDAPADGNQWPVSERSFIGTVLGVPLVAAIALAFVATTLGVFIDFSRVATLGLASKILYFAGCVLAVCWVKRRALFGPMVQPPLLLALAVPVVVLIAGRPPVSGGLGERLLVIGAPLINGFPMMAITTAVTVAIGLVRYRLQRPPKPPKQPRAPVRRARPSTLRDGTAS
jgi:hypothetical protein